MKLRASESGQTVYGRLVGVNITDCKLLLRMFSLYLSYILLQAVSRGMMALVTKCKRTSLASKKNKNYTKLYSQLDKLLQIAFTFCKRLSRTRNRCLNDVDGIWTPTFAYGTVKHLTIVIIAQ